MAVLKILNLALLILFPIAWIAPLARAGLLPFFSLPEISILSGIASLWETDVLLALLVPLFALVFPILKTLLLAGIHWQLLTPRALPLLAIAGKLAMADVFLIATFIVLAKGVGIGRVETAWGIYLFTACVLASIAITHFTGRLSTPPQPEDAPNP